MSRWASYCSRPIREINEGYRIREFDVGGSGARGGGGNQMPNDGSIAEWGGRDVYAV